MTFYSFSDFLNTLLTILTLDLNSASSITHKPRFYLFSYRVLFNLIQRRNVMMAVVLNYNN